MPHRRSSKLTTLIFERIDQRNDIGIDAVLTLARTGQNADLYVNLQIKGGKSFKRKTHIEELYSRHRGYAPFNVVEWERWYWLKPWRACEGHHIIDMNLRLKRIWSNARPTYVIIQDPGVSGLVGCQCPMPAIRVALLNRQLSAYRL
jgi:hypothetical protein